MRWINFFITLRNHSFRIFRMYTKYFWKINIFYPLIRTSNVHVPGKVAQENFFRGGIMAELKLPENFCFIKISSWYVRLLTFILPLVFTYFIISLRNKKKLSLWLWKQSHFCVKRLVLIGVQLIKEYRSIVNGLTKTISD